MIHSQATEIEVLLPQQTFSAAGTNASLVIDMNGYAHAEVVVLAYSSGTTSAIPASITINHNDTNGTGGTAIVSAGTATTGWPSTIVATNTTNASTCFARASLPWLGKKRYLSVAMVAGASACVASAFVIKSRANQTESGTNASGTYSYTFPVS